MPTHQPALPGLQHRGENTKAAGTQEILGACAPATPVPVYARSFSLGSLVVSFTRAACQRAALAPPLHAPRAQPISRIRRAVPSRSMKAIRIEIGATKISLVPIDKELRSSPRPVGEPQTATKKPPLFWTTRRCPLHHTHTHTHPYIRGLENPRRLVSTNSWEQEGALPLGRNRNKCNTLTCRKWQRNNLGKQQGCVKAAAA